MKKNLTSVQKSRIRSVENSMSMLRDCLEGLNRIFDREQNPEKKAMIMDEIQEKSGIMISMENRIKKIKAGGF